ncbi:SRPBCC family protein [Paenibacillus sp. SC116]|uniref:SRPBCC family protein n=1 Tax=Paenibacillus sp. SC116 TaxID=2968986 RepID=UPI00215B238F|nr:SRPBCC family protein [Paenibacillus sp. SC116]MCR8844942.1 SRPBCC family protein [Paenibacillus sp. SC116]
MEDSNYTSTANVEMLIRRPIEQVFQAFIDPEITTKFWFTKSSGRLEQGKQVRWDWEMYGVGSDVDVKEIEENQRIFIELDDRTTVDWVFTPRSENETMVTITNAGFKGTQEEIVNQVIDSTGGFTIVLCGLKAFLEQGILLHLVADRFPDANVNK